jgi:hypothetical protein
MDRFLAPSGASLRRRNAFLDATDAWPGGRNVFTLARTAILARRRGPRAAGGPFLLLRTPPLPVTKVRLAPRTAGS